MEMKVTRRQFFKICAGGMAGSSLAMMGYSPTPALAEARSFKLARATEHRSICPYCSVSCGMILYTLGDTAKNVKPAIMYVEGDPDHPVNRGTLCPKGAGVLDMIHSPNRVKYPEVREPGSNEWKRISWDEAIERIAKLMKDDRDKNFVKTNAAGTHPCGFKWVTEAMQHRKAKLVVVDPRFTRSAAVADFYAPLRVGTDIAFLGGVINYLLTHDKI